MEKTITGKFEVEMKPLDAHYAGDGENKLARMSLNKSFEGDLTASSKGEMLSVMTATKGSAGYVALENVEGTLLGKAGTFVLQHYGLMASGMHELTLEVVPDSGTRELVGLSGAMKINNEGGEHSYEFTFQFQ
jgi:hypothetical protein